MTTATASTASLSSFLPEGVEIRVRQMDFDFSDLHKNWHSNNPLITAFVSAMSAVFPEGERFFIHSIRNVQQEIIDQELKQLVRAFIGQEAHHGNQHETFNALLEERWNFPMQRINDHVRTRFNLGPKKLPKHQQLAITMALEHFTAILAHQVLTRTDDLLGSAPASVQHLFTWHAIEETEHKAVAYDVYRAIGGDENLRRRVMITTTLFFFLFVTRYQLEILFASRAIPTPKDWWEFMGFMLGKKGVLRKILPDYLDYFRRDFHPWDHDNSQLVAQWRSQYPEVADAEQAAA